MRSFVMYTKMYVINSPRIACWCFALLSLSGPFTFLYTRNIHTCKYMGLHICKTLNHKHTHTHTHIRILFTMDQRLIGRICILTGGCDVAGIKHLHLAVILSLVLVTHAHPNGEDRRNLIMYMLCVWIDTNLQNHTCVITVTCHFTPHPPQE
jgi:hypothetical protein